MIEKEDFIQIERLLSLTVMRKTDAALLQELMVKYVDVEVKLGLLKEDLELGLPLIKTM
jgi:hypothetical protein